MDPIQLDAGIGAVKPATAAAAPKGPTFAERFQNALLDANQSLQTAEQSARELADGKTDVVNSVIALSRAELSLRHVAALRDRVFEAYREIMRLQL